MVTADEARRIRLKKGAVNHETYKEIYGKITNRIKLAAARGESNLEFTIPPLIPGRPMYEMSHAMRYNRDKLIHNGYRVDTFSDDTLRVDWKPDANAPKTSARPARCAEPKTPALTKSFGSSSGISQKLQLLKQRLQW